VAEKTRNSLEHFPGLDGLRGFTVSVIVVYHMVKEFELPLPSPVRNLIMHGWISLDPFFVLSGFLITGVLLKSKGQPRYWRTFAIRRALRILPLYLGFLLVMSPLIVRNADVFPILAYFTCTQNWWIATRPTPFSLTPTWSLAVEEQFYLVWPFVIWACSRRQLLWLCIVIILMSPFVRLMAVDAAGEGAAYVWTICRMDALATGAVIRLLHKEPLMNTWAKHWALPALALGALTASLGLWQRHDLWFISIGYTLSVLTFGALVQCLVTDTTPVLSRMVGSKVFKALGQVSYGIYLLHTTCIVSMAVLMRSLGLEPSSGLLTSLVFMALSGSLTVVLASLTWHAWEKRWLGLKSWLAP
jgi:peptidoglycan/LPS O-acetylase OafA/YrhL